MRYEAINPRDKRFYFTIDVACIPNWFERVILREKQTTRKYKGPIDNLHWFRCDGDRFYKENDKDITELIDLEYYFFYHPHIAKAINKTLNK